MVAVAGCTPLTPTTRYGTLTLNGVLMHRGAWNVVNVEDLWLRGPQTRGTDRIIPGVNGVVSYRRRPTATRVSLLTAISGAVNLSGVAAADSVAQLQANIDYLRLNVTDPPGVGDGTILASVVMPNGVTRTADVTVEGFTQGRVFRAIASCSIDLTLPTSVLV